MTCVVDAAMVYEISGAGETASTGSSEAPHQLCDVWVYERALGDGGSWRLKERLGTLSELQRQVLQVIEACQERRDVFVCQ